MANFTALFLKEPGKSITFQARTIANPKLLKSLSVGTELQLKSKNKAITLSNGKDAVAEIDNEEVRKKILYAMDKKFLLSFFTIKNNKQYLDVIVQCNKPIFLGSRSSEIKPFTKHEEVLEEDLGREVTILGNEDDNLEEDEKFGTHIDDGVDSNS